MANEFGYRVSIADTAAIDRSCLDDYSRVKHYAEVRDCVIGAYSYVSQYTLINKTRVGKFSSIANGCHIGLWEHNTDVSTHTFYLYETSGFFVEGYTNLDKDVVETRIGSDVWVGANSVILKGVSIQDGAIIGAGSVVTKDVGPYTIVAGNPARIIKKRFAPNDIEFLLETRWWDYPREFIQQMVDKQLFSNFKAFKLFVQNKGGSDLPAEKE